MMELNVYFTEARNGMPTVQIEKDGKQLFIHSKYDPVKEAAQLLAKYEVEIEKSNHILFYGVGIGYHVKAFIDLYPKKIVSMYEPIAQIGKKQNEYSKKIGLDFNDVMYSAVGGNETDDEQFLHSMSNHLSQKVRIIALPAYERILKEELLGFIEKFKEAIEMKEDHTLAERVFARRWTLNTLMNLPYEFESPNFLRDYRDKLKNKPVVLISAGPSLSEEIEHLKYIKENKLAYLFAVGSANKALIANGLYPDAVFSYDPQKHNANVFKPIIENNIQSIPLVYGTSVGYETIENYPGKKACFSTTQDTVSQFFHEEELLVIRDASSIAVVALEVFISLQVKEIILVGQNFAFKNNLYYSNEIQRYDREKEELTDASVQKKDLSGELYVDDVYGNKVLTNEGFNSMRVQMERYIKENPGIPIINTTNGGANIEGTNFFHLSSLIKEKLTVPAVEEHWMETNKKYEVSSYAAQQMEVFQREIVQFSRAYEELSEFINRTIKSIDTIRESQVSKTTSEFDRRVRKLTSNKMYEMVIRPITRTTYKQLLRKTELLRKQNETKNKLNATINAFVPYITECFEVFKEFAPVIQNVVAPRFASGAGKKYYTAVSGVVQYEGDWEKEYIPPKSLPAGSTKEQIKERSMQEQLLDEVELGIRNVRTQDSNAKFRFKFTGRAISLYGVNYSEKPLKIRVIIDDKITNITFKGVEARYNSAMKFTEKLFEVDKLQSRMHEVEVKVISSNVDFALSAIQIDKDGRAYYIDEVMSVRELEIGKRIRCHYKASKNKVGIFTGLGEERGEFLPAEATSMPDGDFYFLMVDETESGKKLIADRNVQNEISWDELYKKGLATLKGISYRDKNVFGVLRLLSEETGANDECSEWTKYIVKSNLNERIKAGSDLTWNWSDRRFTWTLEAGVDSTGYFRAGLRSPFYHVDWQWKKKEEGVAAYNRIRTKFEMHPAAYRVMFIVNTKNY